MHASGLTLLLAFTFTTSWELSGGRFWAVHWVGGHQSREVMESLATLVTLCGQISKLWPAAKRVAVEAGVVMSRLFAAACVQPTLKWRLLTLYVSISW